MKFEEKIVKLRKANALSQEDLADKLNVARQTISKWELGQSKPDMEKMLEITKLFNVKLENLTNDDLELDSNTNSVKSKSGGKKFIIFVLIFVLIVLGLRVVLVASVYNKQKELASQFADFTPQSFYELFFENSGKLFEQFKITSNQMIKDYEEKSQEMIDEYNKKSQEMTDEYNKKSQEMTDEYNKKSQEMTDEYNKKSQEMIDEYNKNAEEMKKKSNEDSQQIMKMQKSLMEQYTNME